MLLDVVNVSKKFILHECRGDRFSNLITSIIQAKKFKKDRQFWALKDVNITLEQGKSLGIIGKNGSGKSTLLKIINGTMLPTTGFININGTKSALIELGAGFNPDFPGRDNVFLSGMIMGMSKKEINQRFDEIIDFAEIKEFIDIPVKYYSSGMQARLGFSVAIAVKPDMLIVDEVLAVGDANFKEKCKNKIAKLQKEGVSILFVSHDISEVSNICQEAVWLEKGEIMQYGPTDEVVRAYKEFINQSA
ncbi:ABC transporter ATP-binding protein [Pelotomaculum isophthalicicum JI]|uniref:ABC transporter ATP-binding protein n=1 Tax=Pelotomaculum isophthalicicum JI TaxID=947010 RepID=A0A9X4H3B8_9FIRM|nr:ABC transporter ATP-binding protein [Pelotomaculum isophthalicicum]MDF9407908.1 ABC transporter ATP-binding protein [Pelotomaculum isophthalicicum JI]